jgi:glutathione S-transferase
VTVDIFAGDTLTDDYARINPVREVPALELDDGEVVTQSGAIGWLLAEGTPYLPGDPLGRARVVQWLAFEQEQIMGTLGGVRFRVMTGRLDPEAPAAAARVANGRRALDVLEARLSGADWMAGDAPSIADLALYPYTSRAGDAGIDLANWPAVTAWLERLRGLDRFADDLVPYPENARAGASRSIYD